MSSSPRVSHLFIKTAHGAPMEPRPEVQAVSGRGLAGDVAFGTARRQVLLIDSETLSDHDLVPGASRENITTQGLPLQGIPRGTRLHMGEVVLEVTGDCTPCDYLDQLRPGLRSALTGKRGLLARVERGGPLRIGTPIHRDLASPLAGGAEA